jgi:DNA-binding NarL/FixJ family response regulator
MTIENQAAIEAEIGQLLLDHWDPLGMRDQPEPHARYPEYAHEVYNLLARGASNTQIGRRLHQAESGELNHPELATHDLTPLLHALRLIEKRI